MKPTPEEIERLVCKKAHIVKEATGKVCKLITELFINVPECEAHVKTLKDKIKELTCKVAILEFIVKEATTIIMEHFKKAPECAAVVLTLLDKIKDKHLKLHPMQVPECEGIVMTH